MTLIDGVFRLRTGAAVHRLSVVTLDWSEIMDVQV